MPSTKGKKKRKADKYLEVRDLYVAATGETEYEAATIIDWANARGLLRLSAIEIRRMQIIDMSKALRGEKIPGTRARANHVLQVMVAEEGEEGEEITKPRFLWANFRDASPAFLIQSIEERCRAIDADVEQIKIDVEALIPYLESRGHSGLQTHFSWVWSLNGDEQASELSS